MRKAEDRITHYIGDMIDEYNVDELTLNRKMEGLARQINKTILRAAYAKAIYLTLDEAHGEVYPIETFIRMVKRRSVKLYDGVGYYLGPDGVRVFSALVELKEEVLERARLDGARYVDWYYVAFHRKGGG